MLTDENIDIVYRSDELILFAKEKTNGVPIFYKAGNYGSRIARAEPIKKKEFRELLLCKVEEQIVTGDSEDIEKVYKEAKLRYNL